MLTVYCPSGIIHIQTQEHKCNVRGNNEGNQYESVEITNKMQPYLLFQNLLKAQHVSSGIPLIVRSYKLYLQPLVYINQRLVYIN